MSFLNPALLFGALLFAVPLIIHLLNRQRHKRRPWAAMDFLLRAYQKTRNRLRNENLLLLLLRCLIPIVLAFAVARPMLDQAAAMLGQENSDHHVVVLDASYSMGYSAGSGTSPFERGRSMVTRLLDRLATRADRADKVTLVVAGVRPRFIVRGETNLGLARSQWLEVQHPDDAAGDLTAAVAQVADALEESPDPQVRVHVVSDLQVRALGRALAEVVEQPDDAPQFSDTLRDLFERIDSREGTELHLVDVGPFAEQRNGGLADNVQLSDLRLEQPVAIARVPGTVVATVRNLGTATAQAQVTLEIDGAEPMRKLIAVEPGAEAEAEFQVTFREIGGRRLRATLAPDGLEADDSCWLCVEVRDRIRVLVVDGHAERDPLKNYEFFYRGVLDPLSMQEGDSEPAAVEAGGAGLARFAVTACDTLALLSGQQDPGDYDLVILADVDRLNERAADAVLRAMRAGKGLLAAFGPNTDAESFNLHLFAVGEGPMPFRLGRARGEEAGSGVPRSIVIKAADHPVLREFDEDIYREILTRIPIYRWLDTTRDTEQLGDAAAPAADRPAAPGDDATPGDAAASDTAARRRPTVVLELTDRDRSALLVTSGYGEGRAAFLTSPPASELDPDRWNRLDDMYIRFQLIHGLAQWLALPLQDPFNVTVGSALTCTLPARPTDVEVLSSERAGSRKLPVNEEPRPLPGGRYSMPAFTNTTMAGFYLCDLTLEHDTGREPFSRAFAVRVDPDEGALSYAPHDLVIQAVGVERVLTSLPTEADGGIDGGGSELGQTLLLLTLLLVVGEAAMARYVSVRRS